MQPVEHMVGHIVAVFLQEAEVSISTDSMLLESVMCDGSPGLTKKMYRCPVRETVEARFRCYHKLEDFDQIRELPGLCPGFGGISNR